jgi:high-affinity nickel permease
VGDHLASLIFHTFASPLTPTPTLSVYDTVFGLCLLDTLDTWFDLYQLGFRYMAPVRVLPFSSKLFFDELAESVRVP